MSFIYMRMKNDFHIKGWAPTLVLKQRPRGTREWPIPSEVRYVDGKHSGSQQIYVFKHYPPTPLYPIPLALGCLPWTFILTTPSLKKSWIRSWSSQSSDTHWEVYMHSKFNGKSPGNEVVHSTLILIRNGHGWYKGMYMRLSRVRLVQNSRITPTYFTFLSVNFQLILIRIYFGLRWIECFFFPWKFKRMRVSSWISYALTRWRKQTFIISYCASYQKKQSNKHAHKNSWNKTSNL